MNKPQAAWREIHDGGSIQAERKLFERLAADIKNVQSRVAAKSGSAPARTFHSKIVVGVTNARLMVDESIPPYLCAGYFQAGAERRVTIRFSNASSFRRGDDEADMRGAALKIECAPGKYHDLLMTSFPVSHARNARQFVAIAQIATGPKLLILPRLLMSLGVSETKRMLGNIRSASATISSLARQGFWSRAPLLWGDAGPMRYLLRPADRDLPPLPSRDGDPDSLGNEFASRLSQGDITWRLALQPFVDEQRTPIEDGATEWTEQDSPPIEVATVLVPKQDLTTATALAMRDAVDRLAFNPWHCPEPFRPLGSLNRARQIIYPASAQGWLNPESPDT